MSEQSESPTTGPVGALLADRFRIERLIGRGGMAAVYEATDVTLGRTVAVKLFQVDASDAAEPERRSGEIAVLASLNHFALVTLFDAGTAEIDGAPRTFLVMEFVDGRDLRSRIAEGPLGPAEVAEIGADLAEALNYVHSRDIIHLDIKPANVLLAPSEFPGRTGYAKLADFGIARLLDGTGGTATGALLGTASYMSPEQALGAALGPPSDVYSLGLVLLEALTGERAYPGTAIETVTARLQRQPEIPAELGAEWCAVLSAMTRREPEARLSAEEAAVALRLLVSTEAAAAAEDAAEPDEDAIPEEEATGEGEGEAKAEVEPEAEAEAEAEAKAEAAAEAEAEAAAIRAAAAIDFWSSESPAATPAAATDFLSSVDLAPTALMVADPPEGDV